jgi:Domain of unknown function (DUF4388)
LTDAFPISGQIDPKGFPYLVVQLHRRGATGSLKVEGPSYHKALYFRSGRVLFGSSNDPRDQLGAILIEGGKITSEQLEDVSTKVGPGNPLAKVLSDTGFVSQREMSEAARAKVERILSDVLAYAAGSFDFEDGVLPKGAVDLKLATERLIMAAVRRVSDRNFVLRHIDGLDAVLGPTSEMAPRLAEIESETGSLTPHLDGRRTLKEAAAAARLEEFEAAKIACGLLFLGLVERIKTVSASPSTAVAFADADSGNELDLGATAAEAFSVEPEIEEPAVEPEPVVAAASDDEPSFFASEEPAAAEPELSFVNPPFAPPEPQPEARVEAAARPEPQAPPEPVRAVEMPAPAPPRHVDDIPIPSTPFAAEPETVMIKSTPPMAMAMEAEEERDPLSPPVADMSAPLPLVVPERARGGRPRAVAPPPAPKPAVRSDVFVPSAPPSRPSKEDLAALDDLLNSSSLEGPLTPLDKSATMDRGAPTFARSGGGRRVPDSRRAPMLLVLAAVLLALAASGWFYRNRLPGRLGHIASATAAPTLPVAKPLPTTLSPVVTVPAAESPAATPIAPVAVPATLRPAPASTVPAATLPPTTTTTLRPAPAATPHATVAAAPAGDARALLRGARYPEAARAFASSVRGAGKGAAVVQLLIACSTETIQKAVDNASAPELLILPVTFKGRECYRLCWGLYSSESRASAAVRSVPEYFRNGGATPKVLGASEVAP